MSKEVIKRLERGEANSTDEYGRTALHVLVQIYVFTYFRIWHLWDISIKKN